MIGWIIASIVLFIITLVSAFGTYFGLYKEEVEPKGVEPENELSLD
ncbi:hypothetical protein SAMN04488127_0754 [Bhargavaea ginsengi]|uniref:Uncharacterized protein n=1 Tax=Bhargavaea ginsengi TaxID=426757 RepID=A0A1H6UIE4_9BACL|nr:hypothetical protein [Bhargavaea ginsengi]SEI90494.1 hypothetical protein SAMN04488127_0754 [Bhargavaea ginsengi]